MPPAPRILPDWYLRSRLKMRQVLLLVALDEQRNMHRAAASLRMTQPAATRLLGGLERMLGMKLFERGPRGLTPNAYGESLIRHARAMLATLEHAREEMNSLAEGASGRIAIGALLVAAPMFGARTVPARVRVMLALLLALVVFPQVAVPAEVSVISAAGALLLARELVIGFALGFLVQMLFGAVAMAGEVIALSMGLAFASVVDPDRGVSVPVIG
jgi:molybdenum-dependent DNA-binding transcriptional regulator ModE